METRIVTFKDIELARELGEEYGNKYLKKYTDFEEIDPLEYIGLDEADLVYKVTGHKYVDEPDVIVDNFLEGFFDIG